MSSLLDEALKEKYRTNAINDPLAFAKDTVDWSVDLDPLHSDSFLSSLE